MRGLSTDEFTFNQASQMVAITRKGTEYRAVTIVWDRDMNAARNMIYKALCMLRDEEMHPNYSRSTRWNEIENTNRFRGHRHQRRRQ